MATKTFYADGNSGVLAIGTYSANDAIIKAAIANPTSYYSNLNFHSGLNYLQIKEKITYTPGITFAGLTRELKEWDDGGGGNKSSTCFISTTMISLPNGNFCEIQKVKVGDYILNYNGTKSNKVTLVEISTDSKYGGLYSPHCEHKPFATLNHPLYINGRLSSLDPAHSSARYPWLGPTEKITDAEIIPPSDQPVYNLWVTGDGTYQVNGFGTTSIVYDGGFIRQCVDQGIFPMSRASDLLTKFAGTSTTTSYGAYLCNKFLGWADIKIVNRVLGTIYRDDIHYPVLQAISEVVFAIVGAIANRTKYLFNRV